MTEVFGSLPGANVFSSPLANSSRYRPYAYADYEHFGTDMQLTMLHAVNACFALIYFMCSKSFAFMR